MRLNKYIATSSNLSRRAADAAIDAGRVTIDGQTAVKGTEVDKSSQVKLDGTILTPSTTHITLVLNKPVGYVCSRNGQGSATIYDLLPSEYHRINPVGRLDKDSSGLLLMTDDGELANQLTHPRYAKTKVYEITLDKLLVPLHQQMITDHGITLDDGLSRFLVTRQEEEGDGGKKSPDRYEVHMAEGRNRQIRRTFTALGYTVTTLHRTQFGPYSLSDLEMGKHELL
jgi:23S rRNA pseudouridine2605 synthase